MSYNVAGICIVYDPESVITTAAICFSITLALAIYALTTKEDLTIYKVSLCILIPITFMFLLLFLCFRRDIYHLLVYLLIGLIYGIYLAIDSYLLSHHKIMFNFMFGSDMDLHHQAIVIEVDTDDYILASILIYIDIIILFIRILEIIGKFKEND